MRSILLLLSSVLSISLLAQSSDVDLLVEAYETDNPYASIDLLKKIPDATGLNDSLHNLYDLTYGIAYGKLGKVDSALFFLDQCLASTYPYLLSRAGNARGLVFFHAGRFEEAIESYQSALTIAEKNNFQGEIATILGNMGGVYFQMEEYASSMKYSQRSLDVAYAIQSIDDIAYGHLRLAVVHEEIDSLTTSIFHNRKASLFAENLENYVLLTYIEKTLGNIHKKIGNLDSALYHHQRAWEFAVKEGEQENIVSTAIEIARVHLEMGNILQAEKEASEILQLSIDNNYPLETKLAHGLLYEIFLSKGEYQKALNARNGFIAIKDSINAQETKERIAELEIQYETTQKEKEILEANAELNRKERFQQFLFAIIGIIIVFSFIAIFLLIQRFRLRRALLSQEIDTLRVQINSVLGEGVKNLDLNLDRINEGLYKPLSEREYEILTHAVSDQTNSEIAEKVFVSVNTVKTHLKNIYSKLGVSNRKEALEVLLAKS